MNRNNNLHTVHLFLREHWVLHSKSYLFGGLFLLLLMFLMLLAGKSWSAEDGSLTLGQILVYSISLQLVVSITGVWFVQPVRRSPDHYLAMMLPASQGSRIFAGLIWGGLVIPVVLILLMYVALAATFFFIPEHDFPWVTPYQLICQGALKADYQVVSNTFVNALMYQMVFMGGGIYFRNQAWVKTWILVFLLSLLLLGLSILIVHLFVPEIDSGSLSLMLQNKKLFGASGLFHSGWMYVYLSLWVYLYGLLAYYLLKEKQV